MSDESWAMRHYGFLLLLAACTGLFISYCIATVSTWDIDNQYPDLYPHMTLAQWIDVHQIQHAKRMLHELW